MNEILKIVAAAGKDITDPSLYLKVMNDPYMPLVIEAIGEGPDGWPSISVCHYGEQNGDLMMDPEVCFQVAKNYGKTAEGTVELVAYTFRNDYVGVNQTSRWKNNTGQTLVMPKLQAEHRVFARMWNKNIKQQGFLAAVKAGKVEVAA